MVKDIVELNDKLLKFAYGWDVRRKIRGLRGLWRGWKLCYDLGVGYKVILKFSYVVYV